MKPAVLEAICLLPLTLLCQETLEGPWRLACGATENSFFKKYSCLDLRYISPRFKYTTEDWTDEMERHPDKYKKARFMVELAYAPPLKILYTGINLQYRIVKYKNLSIDVYGGMKFMLITPRDFIANRNAAIIANRNGWYMAPGLIFQLDLEIIAPFFDLNYDGMVGVGTELNFRAMYKKPSRRYNLHTQ